MLILYSDHVKAIRAHLEAGYPDEACGMLVGEIDGEVRRVASVVTVKNAWAETHGGASERDRFLIAPDDFVRADREAAKLGHEIIGYFHSHPDSPSRPSETDREWAWPYVSFMIASVTDGKVTSLQSYILRDDRTAFDEEEIQIDEC
jgi:proteasome lid subunit RPN8/RPN11